MQERNIIMLKPTLEKAKELTGYSVIPVCREILSDFTTPIEVLKKLRRVSRHVYILESVENQEKWGRYTFLGYNPKLELTCTNGELTVKDVVTGKTETSHQAHPAAYIKELMKKYTSPKLEGFPSFTGGLVGYFSYDYIKYSEPTLNLDAKDEERFKDVDLMLFDKVIAFDNIHQKIVLITNISTSDLENEYAKAESRPRRNGAAHQERQARRYPARKAPLGVPQAVQRGAVLRNGREGEALHLRGRHIPGGALKPP